MKKLVVSIITVLVFTWYGYSQPQKWSFASYPDWHAGDWDLRDVKPEAYGDQHKVMADIASFKPEFILLTGDMVGGMWLKDELQQKYAPDGSLEKLIMNCGKICYDGVNKRFMEHGLKPYGCLGDHEVGDQNWDVNSRRSQGVLFYKEAFSRAYTLDSDGKSLFNGFIGSVPQRPVGTPYENTSYAIINKNVMVVTVDIFRFESPSVMLDSVRGTIAFDVEGAHKKWLDDVLEAGNKIDSVDFIVVQSHLPVLLPIRKHQTSHLTVLNEEESEFWKILKKHHVDLYYSGEVHAMTPTLDKKSGIIQVVHGSFNNYSSPLINYLIAEVQDDKLTLSSREKKFENDFIFETTGNLVIDKTSGKKVITSSGALTPIDREGLLVHYGFEDPEPVTRIKNTGIFGPRVLYGNNTSLKTTSGVIGQGIEFPAGAGGYSKSFGINPFHGGMARSFACWIKTASPGKMTLISTGDGTFALGLNSGIPQLYANGNQLTVSGKGTTLNDNKWHHIAVTCPGSGHSLSDIIFYIDGKSFKATSSGSDVMNTSPNGFVILGTNTDLNSDFFTGSMDETGLWSSALTAPMVKALYSSATLKDFGYDAASMDKLFHIFREKSGVVKVNDKEWRFASELKGNPGEIVKGKNGLYTIVLNTSGEGVTMEN